MQILKLVAALSVLSVGRVLANPCKPAQPTSSTSSATSSSAISSLISSSTGVSSSSAAVSSSSSAISTSSSVPLSSSSSSVSSSSSISTTNSSPLSSSSTVSSASSSSSITSSSSSVAAGPTCGVNAVSNDNFDGGDSTGDSGPSLSPWTFSSTGGGGYSFVTGDNSPYAINLYTTGAGSATITQTIETVPGEEYTMSFTHYFLTGNTLSYIECVFDNSYGTYKLLYGNALAKDQWIPYTGPVPVTGSTTTYTCKWTSTVTSSIYLEGFQFYYSC
ncbi:hypothetical protein SBRCBS47491_009306 [Sporothrix bragantina]|uniref:CBM-cenC domain-containing protein n=1 Tax=Sporothrix bragantina TaxID=671064 RepID=A0ABP0CTW0_9PEZI